MAASLGVGAPQIQTTNNGPLATCTCHITSGVWVHNNRRRRTCHLTSDGTNYVQFWFNRFRSGIFDVKDAPRTVRPIVENVDKISEIFEVDRHVRTRIIAPGAKDRP
ncbi:hypothetical protein TNCV_1275651 [Trichonephila clavipes]|nr:hypothetical protein TNCV_1275651 [Trichonephila clavipes]